MSRFLLPGIPFLIALALVLAFGKPLIEFLKSRKAQQPISPDAPEKHRLKHGTPTMGGLLILGGTLVAVTAGHFLFPMVWRQHERLTAVLLVFGFGGLIGLLDDLGKARRKENKAGLSERAKLALQLIVAGGFAVFLYVSGHPTTVLGVNLGYFYYLLAVLFLMGFSNAANFTDGLDGLLSGTTLIAAAGLTLACLDRAERPEMAIFYGALAGGCAGFLWWNAYPARAFMGDTGSLAIGMGMAAAALIARLEAPFFLFAVIYLAEIVAMMLQRYVFKYRRIVYGLEYAQSHRVFRRAPLHHHFEELGWHETQVVMRFWVVGLIAAVLGLALLGNRS